MIPRQIRFDDVSDEYAEFVEKFKPKKTTDDCYTPEAVYNAVALWVESEYRVNAGDFVRPFWPGGDYERFEYKPEHIVVDNPPFSILSRICDFYERHGIRYFLFAPYLTNFSIQTCKCHIITDQDIIYENGAIVNTSFVTNMDRAIIRTAPELSGVIEAAKRHARKPVKPRYQYPGSIITSAIVGRMARNGVDFRVYPGDAIFIRQLDAQRPLGKTIFGGGYLLSQKAEAEATRAIEAAKAIEDDTVLTVKFELSAAEKEMQIAIGGDTDGRKNQNV